MKLTPIIKGLEVEGKKHVAQRVEAEIADLPYSLSDSLMNGRSDHHARQGQGKAVHTQRPIGAYNV